MKLAVLFAFVGFAVSLVFVRAAEWVEIEREAADPTDSLYRAILSQPDPPLPWYLAHSVEVVIGVTVGAFVLGLLVAIVVRLER